MAGLCGVLRCVRRVGGVLVLAATTSIAYATVCGWDAYVSSWAFDGTKWCMTVCVVKIASTAPGATFGFGEVLNVVTVKDDGVWRDASDPLTGSTVDGPTYDPGTSSWSSTACFTHCDDDMNSGDVMSVTVSGPNPCGGTGIKTLQRTVP